jgi:hypothetical protein
LTSLSDCFLGIARSIEPNVRLFKRY